MALRLVIAWALLSLTACDRRKPIKIAGDLGPAVVVVDARKRTPPPNVTRPQLPLVDEHEPDDDTAHAQPLEAGKGIRGTVGAPHTVKGKLVGDEDFYSFIESGAVPDGGFDVARVEVTGVPGVDLGLEVLDGDGKKLEAVNDNPEGKGEVISNLAVEPGHTYFVRVRALNAVAGAEPYELTVVSGPASAFDEREPNDGAARATPVTAPADLTGYFGHRRDEDWFRLDGVVAGAALKLELGAVLEVAPELRLLRGAKVLTSARVGRGDELRLRNAGVGDSADPVYLVLRAAEGRNVDQRYLLRMSLEAPLDGAEREPNDTLASANELALSAGRVSGFLWPGDADCYRVAGAGGLVAVSIDGVPHVDLKLEALGADGKPTMKADDAGPDKGEALPPLPGANLVVRVSARARDTAFDVPYTLNVTSVAGGDDVEREPNGSSATATEWKGESMRGWLAPRGDEDVFRYTVPAGMSKLTAELTPPRGVSTSLRVVDESRLPAGPSGDRKVVATVTAGKTYFVSVRAANDKQANSTDTYTLTLHAE